MDNNPIINALLIYQLKYIVKFFLLENITEEDYKILNCLKDTFIEEQDAQIIEDALTKNIEHCKGSKKEYYGKWANSEIQLPIYKPCINLVYHYET